MSKSAASLKKRLLALLVDILLIIVYVIGLLGVTQLLYHIFLDGPPAMGRLGEELIAFSTLLSPVFLYFVITEYGKARATFGKRMMHIHIDSIGNLPLTLTQVILKNIIKLLPWQMAHTFIFTGFHNDWNIPVFAFVLFMVIIYGLPILSIFIICIRNDHCSIHDLIANTIVLEGDYDTTYDRHKDCQDDENNNIFFG
ncbi:RDD family protein [Virgibacillus dakarensis]|uniref:RDD family protein n=1 Tax=Virgibacillus dakarensis TaxID=1917889 RepID=UPI0013562A96|nr:RDD family protein [Virgibacillus dakarensis]